MDFQTMHIARDGHVLTVTIDHPGSPMNAVDATLHHEFGELFRMLEQEADARVIVLTGSGRAFSAGGDMGWFPELRDPARMHALRREAKQIIWDQLDVEIPIVCALNGPAVGLGASIALLCDVIVMAERRRSSTRMCRSGSSPGMVEQRSGRCSSGPLAAKRHLMLGEPLTAAEALRLGVAAEMCTAADLDASARAWADRIAAQPPLAVQGTKVSVNQQIKQALLISFDLSTSLEMPCFLSADHAEAVSAFVEKRTPTFEGR